MIYVQQEIINFTYSNITQTALEWNSNIIIAGSFIIGSRYKIIALGSTNFTLIGATTNTVGLVFTATGVGTGTGTAQTAYLVEDMVRVGSYHYKATYGTLTLPNIGKPPLENLGTAWYKYEPSNTYACLDPYGETKTTWTADGIAEFTRDTKDTLGIGNFTATQVKIEYKDILGAVIDTQIYTYSNNAYVFDEWDYGYAGFSTSVNQVIYLPLLKKGITIRVTFSKSGAATDCGFMIAGKSTFMGNTLDEVGFPDKRLGSRTVSVADFNTKLDSKDLMRKIAEAKALVNENMLFVIDENTSSVHQNMVILGKITQCSGSANSSTKNQINWQIEENKLQ